MRLTWALAVLLALSGSGLARTEPDRFGDGGVPAFYQWPGPVPEPGVLLRSEALPANLLLSNAARGERILYSVYARIRKSLGEMTRKLSDTASQ